jgi:ABC-type oligopeptide transport system substrate-binding subunit
MATAVTVALVAACTNGTDKATPAAGPRGGTLRVGITEPGSLDPGNAYEPAGMLVDSLLCEPLLTLDPVSGRLRPGLATNWVISDGGRRITLRLRKARFSNGQKVTSDDVIASLSRAASEEFAGNAAGLLESVDGWPEITGRVETRRERDRRILRGLSAIDGSSLSITLSRRDADFLRVLAHPVAAPVPHELAERDPDAFAAQPVCAGPYRLAQPWEAGAPVIKLERNRGYYGRNPAFTAGGAGYADTVEFYVSTDPLAAWQAGTVDVAAVPNAQRNAVAAADLRERPSGYIEYVGLPLNEESPFKDADVRRALSAALDRRAIAEATGRQPANGFVPGGKGCPTEPRRTDLHGDATVPLYYNDEFGNRTTAELVARQWHDAFGFDVRPTPVTFDRIVELGTRPQGIDGAFRFGWQPSAPRPDEYLAPLFTSKGIGRDNLTRFVDPSFERVLNRQARGATKQGDVDAGYRSAERLLCDAMPMIPVTAGVSRFAVRSAALGAAGRSTLDAARGWPVLRELYVRSGGNR